MNEEMVINQMSAEDIHNKNIFEFKQLAIMNINRDGIEDLMNYLEKETDFFNAPASTKYHGAYKGGLVQHSLDVYYALIDELRFIFGENWEKRYNLETVTIVSLFHDLCKANSYILDTRNVKDKITGQWTQVPFYTYDNSKVNMGHGSQSVYEVTRFMNLSFEEQLAIYWHMGAYDISQYSTAYDLSTAYVNSTLAFALNRADMFATYITDNPKFIPVDEG